MNKFFVLSAIVFSIFFFACEDDTIPIPLPPSQPSANAPGEENTEKAESQASAGKSSEPAKTAKSSAKEKPPAKAKEAPAPKTVAYFDGDAEQLKTGRYIIQVGIFPTEASAKRVIKKLAENGIKAYNAKVDNPDPEKGMIGTYNRVRVGFFDAKPAAEAFAKTKLEPLGYAWWIDRSKNDNIGKVAYYSEPEPVFEVERIQEQPKQMSAQERREAEKAAAIAAAKEEYRAIAKAANASVSIPPPSVPAKAPKAAPPPPAPQAPPPKLAAPKAPPPAAKAAPPPPAAAKAPAPAASAKEAEIDNRGKVKMKKKNP